MLDDIYSWQECGNCQKPDLLKSLFVSGLRCHNSTTCKTWRWRNNWVNIRNTDDLRLPQIPVLKSPPRRCWLFNDEINIDAFESLPSYGLTVSGDQSCYEQIYGNNAGCFKQNVKWCFPSTQGEIVTNSGPSGTSTSTSASTSTKRVQVPLFLPLTKRTAIRTSWGACAEECIERGCDYWTWASTSCTNCSPHSCTLFTLTDQTRDQVEEQTLEAPGHISGRKDCSDIDQFLARSNTKFVQRHNDTGNLEFPVGRCQTPQPTTNPRCEGQEVPGYR